MKNWRWLVLFLFLIAMSAFTARFRAEAAQLIASGHLYSFLETQAVHPEGQASERPRVVTITAKRFEFSPSRITLKKGETVKLLLKSEDVTHGFLMKALGIDTDIPAGETAEVTLTPQAPGKFTTICDHFCGAGHGNMKMTIVVE